MIRKLYKFSYTVGSVMVILSMLMSLVPAFPVYAAQGSTKTSAGTCSNPVNKNHYVVGDHIILHFEGFDPNTTFAWNISGNPGGSSGDPGQTVASGSFTSDANGDGCVNAYTVQPDDWGEYHVTVDGGKGDNYRVEGGEEPPPPDPNFTVSKSPSVSSVMAPGDNVTFSISISNTGNQDLVLTQLSDNVFENIGNCAGLAGNNLAIGQTLTCSFVGYVSGAAGSSHVNTFTARATAGQTTLVASDNATVQITAPPVLGVNVQKTANPTSLQASGGSVTYSVLVTNTSNVAVTLSNLNDNMFGNLAGQGSCSVPQSLAVGGTYSCSFSGEVSGSAGDSHTNTITATISHSSGSASGSDSATVNIIDSTVLGINVTKSASPTSVTEPGGNVDFTVTVFNTSNVDVTLTSLNDSVFGDLNGEGTCSTGGTIPASGSYSCVVSAFISGPHTNTVTGSVSYQGQSVSDSGTASVTYNVQPDPTISVSKTVNPSQLDEPGGSVTFSVSVNNTSATAVTLTSLVDNVFGNLNGVGNCVTGGSIAAGGSYNCSFSQQVNGTSSTPHTDTVTAQVVDDFDNTAVGSDSATVTFSPLPTISVSKTANPGTLSELGGNTTFTIVVNNTSGEALTLNSLNDSVFGDLNGQGDCSLPQSMVAGGSYQCSFTRFLVGNPGSFHTNVVTATAQDGDGNQAQATDSEQVGFEDQAPSISVNKSAFPTSIDEPGGFVDFTFQITNTSQEAVTITSLSDSVFGELSQVTGCENAVGQSIPAGGSFSCTISGLVSGDAGDVHQNTVTAVVSDNDGNNASGSASASVNITNVPTVIEVTKSANPTEVAEPGGSVTFTVAIQNLSGEAITLTSLVDDIYGDLNNQGDCSVPQGIAIGGSYSCSFSAQVTGDAGDLHINTVTGTAEDNEGGSVSDSGSAQVSVTDVLPSIQVIKSASPGSTPAPLGAITYTVEVQNQSAEAVTLNQLVDDIFGDLDGTGDCQIGGSIPAGGSYSCSFVKNIAGAAGDSHVNVVTVTVSDNEGNPASGADDATVTFTSSPELMLVDPCTVGCDQEVVEGQLCNGDVENDYNGTINWTAYVDNTPIGSGTVQGVPAGECIALTAPQSGDGLYSIVAVLVDEDNQEIVTSCGPLVCTVDPEPTPTPTQVPPGSPTPIPPVDPPSETPAEVFIPVTGLDLSANSLIAKLQNFGFALISLGLVLHGFTLKEKKQKKSAK